MGVISHGSYWYLGCSPSWDWGQQQYGAGAGGGDSDDSSSWLRIHRDRAGMNSWAPALGTFGLSMLTAPPTGRRKVAEGA